MGLLKNNISMRNSIKGKLSTILSFIDEIDENIANDLVNWFIKQAEHYDKHINKKRFHKLPDNISRGDIVLADLGMNIHPELSDSGTDKHFVLIWGQQGQNFIVIPLTKHPQPAYNNYGVNLGKIAGLPTDNDTYAKIDAIRSISIRRIHRIKEQPNGKIVISDIALLESISNIFETQFIIKK